jgi:hypothetical protein
MADDLTNLLQANRSASVLQGIMNPAQVNPLAAMTSAAQTAGTIFDARAKQGQGLWGQALQQSTDPTTGVVDYQKANRIAATMGPAAAQVAGVNLGNNSNLTGAQLEQAVARTNFVGSLAASGMNDPSDANWAKIRAQAVAANLPPSALAEIDRISAMPQEQRGAEAYKHVLGKMDALSQMARSPYATPTMTNVGAATVPVTNIPATPWSPGSSTVRSGGATVGPPAGSTTSATVPMDDQGIIPQDANGVPARPPKRWQPVMVPTTAVPGIPAGGQTVVSPSSGASGGGSQPAPTPPKPGAPPIPTGYQPRTPAPNASGGGDTSGGTDIPWQLPSTPVSAQPAPAVPTQAPAPVPPTGSGPSVAKPPLMTSAPQGQPEKLQADVAAYTNDQATIPTQMTRVQNIAHAYDALNMLKSATGKGAAGINDVRSYLQTLGLLPQGAVKEQELFEIARKYAERSMLDAAGGASTDLGKRMQETASPGTILSTSANFELMRNDLGKSLQTVAAYKDQPDKTGTGYLENRAKLADVTDPRGFVWSLYSTEEQAKINAEVEKNPDAAAKLHKAIGMAGRLQLQAPVTTPAVRQKQSFLAPPAMSAQNPLQMTG